MLLTWSSTTPEQGGREPCQPSPAYAASFWRNESGTVAKGPPIKTTYNQLHYTSMHLAWIGVYQ